MNFKKLTAAAVCAAMVLSLLPAAAAAEESKETETGLFGVILEETQKQKQKQKEKKDGGDDISQKTVPCYLEETETVFDLPVYFLNGVEDLPFIDLKDWADVLVTVYHYYEDEDYELYIETDDHVAQLTRETDYSMLCDFNAKTIAFDDYDGFIHAANDNSLLDMVSMDLYNEEGKQIVLERIDRGSFDRYGKEIELNLSDYDIPMVWSEADGLYLIPLQTLGDFFLAPPIGLNVFFNGDAVYLASETDFGLDSEELTDLGVSYYSAPYGKMSEELAWYNYCELCLAMDHLYGLKEIHDISSFDNIFTETGYRYDLCSTDPGVAEGALNDFIYYYLDDLHSGFTVQSFRTEELDSIGGTGLSSIQDEVNGEIFANARESADEEILSYQEVGDTAYVTFDAFAVNVDPSEYYENNAEVEVDAYPDSADLDTIGLIIYAHEQICREDSPIKNVVIDLSLNGGGALDACAFVAAWFLGDASTSVRSSMTGAVSTGKYRVDTNLDGTFDKEDCVTDKNLYCLIGPYSFSCGNLLPNIFKSSNRVTLLGQTSGGGSCSILPMSTASGAIFQMSSPYRMSYLKNGSYYDIDLGVEPDCFISKPENYYDREALTEYIHQLF